MLATVVAALSLVGQAGRPSSGSTSLKTLAGSKIKRVEFRSNGKSGLVFLDLLVAGSLQSVVSGLSTDLDVRRPNGKPPFLLKRNFAEVGRLGLFRISQVRGTLKSCLVSVELSMGRPLPDNRLNAMSPVLNDGFLQGMEIDVDGSSAIALVIKSPYDSKRVSRAAIAAGWRDKGERGLLPRFLSDYKGWGIRMFLDPAESKSLSGCCSLFIGFDYSEFFKSR